MRAPYVNWWVRADRAEEFACEVIATAHDQDPRSPDLPLAFPLLFAELVCAWSQAHPPPPPWQYDPRAGTVTRPPLPDWTVVCTVCRRAVYPDALERAGEGCGDGAAVCRRCAALGREAAREGR